MKILVESDIAAVQHNFFDLFQMEIEAVSSQVEATKLN